MKDRGPRKSGKRPSDPTMVQLAALAELPDFSTKRENPGSTQKKPRVEETELRIQGNRAARVHREKSQRGDSFTERRLQTPAEGPQGVFSRVLPSTVSEGNDNPTGAEGTVDSAQQDWEWRLSHQTGNPHNSQGKCLASVPGNNDAKLNRASPGPA